MPQAWNNWYHVTLHTYGAWLRGDPRGWRSRHHREHVIGDYKSRPPCGTDQWMRDQSLSAMKRQAIQISDDLKPTVLLSLVDKLKKDDIEVVIACLDDVHAHLLARFCDNRPRHWIGRAKLHASHSLRQSGLRDGESGGLWAKRSYARPIADRKHQLSVVRYIASHHQRGAIVWRFDRPFKAHE